MSCRVRLQYANIRYLFMFRFAHSLTRSLAPTHCPIPFFIYPLRMHDFSILHCCTKVGIAIYPPWRIHIQNWVRYSLILISCACSVRGIYLRASDAASREFGVQVYLVVSAIHDTKLHGQCSVSLCPMRSECNGLTSIAASKAQAKNEKNEKNRNL